MEKVMGILNKSGGSSFSGNTWIFIILLIIWMVTYFSVGSWYKYTYGQYRSNKASVLNLINVKTGILQHDIGNLSPQYTSVCSKFNNNVVPYNQLSENDIPLVNWRPLTVRLAGYLGGIHTGLDGVFDMNIGIDLAIKQGARAFVFDIDYLESAPCKPVVIFRDSKGYMRSLHTGSIQKGCEALNEHAFSANNDPVLVILYFHRVPSGKNQKGIYLRNVAQQLSALGTHHLRSNQSGSFNNCKNESHLFTSPINNYESNFIVISNHNTKDVFSSTAGGTDSLDFWTHARIYKDSLGDSSDLGLVTQAQPPTGAHALVGSISQFLHLPDPPSFMSSEDRAAKFLIALGAVDYQYTTTELSTLLNTDGIQCVPLDLLTLARSPEHVKTLNIAAVNTIESLSNAANPNDPLSFWKYAGWSRKLINMEYNKEGFQDMPPAIPKAARIPGFVIPTPVVPKEPHPSMNSNGGLVSIA